MTTDAWQFLAEVWRHEPSIILYLAIGSVVFALLVVDSHRLHREKRLRQRTGLY